MKSERLEAFSDGVFAIIITIMVLELESPKEDILEALSELAPIFISYLASFIYVGMYWNHHHQLFKISKKLNKKVLWINLHLLFWLSLIPFTTAWIGDGDNHRVGVPVVFYGFVLLMCELSFLLLRIAMIKIHGTTSDIGSRLKVNVKDLRCLVIYLSGIALAILDTYGAISCFVLVGFLKIIRPNVKNFEPELSVTTIL